MAEASSRDQPTFFCHKCITEIRPVLPDYLCPNCNGGFIEQIHVEDSTDQSHSQSDESNRSADERRSSVDSESDPLQTLFVSTLLNELSDTGNRSSGRSNHSSPSSSSSSTSQSPLGGGPSSASNSSSSQNSSHHTSSISSASGSSNSSSNMSSSNATSRRSPGAADSNRSFTMMHGPGINRTTLTFHRHGMDGPHPPSTDMMALIQQILGMANPPPGPGGVYFPVQMLNIHGSPRDYAWGEGGLDAVITQLLNNAEGGHGPPPAPQAAISRLETIRISNIHIEQSQECPVCKEDFKNEESAKMLPCTHFFHPDCITTWLEMHNTCPVCRKAISDSTSSSHAR
ncbi:E3 ubiquitin-protein ligase RNF126-B-like isoform X2 [Diadema antillarum]|uniref:E3 ubiquitin-protein ligase RNF126-B-like isoform X2 n=1 Tax=Diadema antillarum TaxID=105358 RepID=UPI003A88F7B5